MKKEFKKTELLEAIVQVIGEYSYIISKNVSGLEAIKSLGVFMFSDRCSIYQLVGNMFDDETHPKHHNYTLDSIKNRVDFYKKMHRKILNSI